MQGYSAQADMKSSFDQLKEALTLLVNIYDRLENYKDQQALGGYIGNIGAPGDYTDLHQGTEFENGIRTVNETIQANLILMEYENVMQAFRQWVFPFAKPYLAASKLPTNIKPTRDKETLKELVSGANSQIKAARGNISRYWSTIQFNDKFSYIGKFYTNKESGGPFFRWEQETHKEKINKLLLGKQITLLADVRQSWKWVPQRKAIKFQKVFLNFHLRNGWKDEKKDTQRQDKFNAALDYFVVRLEHSGISYYDFLDDYFAIPGDSVTLNYGIKGNDKNDPDIKSISSGKVLKGDVLLSPYTLWTLQLLAENKEEALAKLKEFVNDVDVELVGSGTYIWDTKNLLPALDLRVREYYQVLGERGVEEPNQ